MKKALAAMATMVLSVVIIASQAVAGQYVRGYTRSDGTYVAPHYRSSPDSSPYNNYSTYGNTNPYTGETGTKRVNPYESGGLGSGTGQRNSYGIYDR